MLDLYSTKGAVVPNASFHDYGNSENFANCTQVQIMLQTFIFQFSPTPVSLVNDQMASKGTEIIGTDK